MILLALVFLAIAVGAGFLGFGPATGVAGPLAKGVFVTALLLFMLCMVAGIFRDTLRSLTAIDERRR